MKIDNNLEVDILLERITNQTKDFIFGSNSLIGTTLEDIWSAGGLYNWLTVPVLLDIKSNDIEDDVKGLGAQVIAIIGLDSNWNEQTEVILMNGNGITTTKNTFIRVNRCVVVKSGTLRGSNFNDISILSTGGDVLVCFITGQGTKGFNYGFGLSQICIFSIPRGKSLIVEDLTINVSGGKVMNIQAFGLTNPEQLGSSKLLLFQVLDLLGIFRAGKAEYEIIAPMTDIWFSGFTSNSTSSVDIRMYYKLVNTN